MTGILASVLRLFGGSSSTPAPPAAPEEPLVAGENAILCVCDEEWCFCTNLVASPLDALRGLAELGVGVRMGNSPCAECRSGKHVWSPPST